MELNEGIETEHSESEDPEPTTSVVTIDEECSDPSDQTISIDVEGRKPVLRRQKENAFSISNG